MDSEYFNKVADTLSAATGLDLDTSKELVDLFRSKSMEMILLAKNAYAENRIDELKEHIHKIKGSSGNVRAVAISELALSIEEKINKDPAADVGKELEEIEEFIKRLS